MINRVVFISVLMIISLTAAASPCLNGKVAADTSVIPVTKTQITGKPLAEKVETDKKEVDNTVKSKTVKSKTAGTATTTANTKKTNSSEAPVKKTDATTTSVKKKVAGTTAAPKKVPVIPGRADDGSTSTAIKTTAGSNTAASKKSSATNAAAKKTTATTTAAKKTTTNTAVKRAAASKAVADNAVTTYKSVAKTRSSSKSKTRKVPKGIGIELYQPLAFKYAILLDVPVEKMIDDKLLEVLDHWYGTRYRFGGESRRGIDCSAFTQAFMISYFDYELPRRAEEQYAKCKHIKKKKLRQGDLVFFKTKGPKGGITHVGVYLVNNRFVHSATSTGVRISNLGDDYYKEHYAGAGRIR